MSLAPQVPHPFPVRARRPFGPTATGLAIAVASAAAFGAAGPFAKSLLDAGWSPSAAVLVRVGGAALVLLPAVIRAWLRAKPSAADTRTVAVYGVVAVAGAQICYFSAVQSLSVGVALLLEYLAPVLLVGLAWLRTGRAPGTRTIVGTVLSIAGLVLVLDVAGGAQVNLVGVVWGLAAAVCLSAYFVLSAKVSDALPAVVLAGGGLAVGTVAIGVLALVGVFPAQFTAASVDLAGLVLPWFVPVVVLVLVSTVLAYLTGIAAVGRLGSRVASFVGLTEVLFAVVFAALLLGQLPLVVQLAGGVLILLGVGLVNADKAQNGSVAVEVMTERDTVVVS